VSRPVAVARTAHILRPVRVRGVALAELAASGALARDIEEALDARFVREFPNESLDGDPSEQGGG
jgi:hypothetical protein